MTEEAYRRIPLYARDGSIRAHALVDEADYERFGSLRWSLIRGGYVYRSLKTGGKQYGYYLHREVLGLSKGDGLIADHINRDKLDNRRSNLRVVTPSESVQNLSNQTGRLSQYRGVSRKGNRWSATVVFNGEHNHVGLYGTELDAAAAAAQWRQEHFPNAVEDPALLAHKVERDKPRSSRAVLDEEQVLVVRRFYLAGHTAANSARKAGVPTTAIYNIVCGKSYGDLPLAEETKAEWQRRKRTRSVDHQLSNSR